MWPLIVVMTDIDAEDPLELSVVEDEHVQPPQQHAVDSEKVAGERRGGMLAQERSPARPVALRRRRDTCRSEDVAYQRRGDVNAELAQLADDPHVAPFQFFRELAV